MHIGRSNEHKLRNNGKKITLKPIFATAVRSMRIQQAKRPSLSILTTKKEVK